MEPDADRPSVSVAHIPAGAPEAAPRVLVVLPTYQEAENIVTVLQRIRRAVPDADVLVVDDSSPDGTADSGRGERPTSSAASRSCAAPARRASARRTAPASLGPGPGLDVLVEMDADLSHDPTRCPSLLAAVGARRRPRHRVALRRRAGRSPAGRGTAGRCRGGATATRRRCSASDVRDATAGFRAYRADMLRRHRPRRGAGRRLRLPDRDDVPRRADRRHASSRCRSRSATAPQGKSKMSGRIVVEALWLVTWWGIRRTVAPWRNGRRLAR